jgi:hypothetical protein
MFVPWFALGAGLVVTHRSRSRLTFVVEQSDLMMHYDITVNDDCEIRLSGDQTFFVTHIFRLMLSKFPSIRVET